ncbi:MAG TPA: DUF58 domain-containing protein, partial [Albitalea sp.]|nr:DUF58 domain-containing protein [Albitalea sp.]
DWNVTARLQTPYVREFTEDRELNAWFVLDLSGSIDFGSQQRTKREVSAEFVTVLSRLLTRHGNRVGAILYGSEVGAVLPARGGRVHVLNLLQRMRGFEARPSGAETQLQRLLLAAQQMITRRSMVFVVSDFISAPGWEQALARLAQRHEVLAVRLYDAAELELPDLGLVTIQDAETGEQLFVDTHDAGFRERFEKASEQHEEMLHDGFLKAGVDTLELATDDDLVDAVLRFAEMRRQRSRLAAGGGLPAHLAPRTTWSGSTPGGAA